MKNYRGKLESVVRDQAAYHQYRANLPFRQKVREAFPQIGQVFDLLNRMVEDGVIQSYVIGGAVASFFYLEPSLTKDLDVFVYLQRTSQGLISLGKIYEYLESKNFKGEGQWIKIYGVDTEFIEPYSPLVEEAFLNSFQVTFEQVPIRIFSVEYQIGICLEAGKRKYLARIEAFLEQARDKINLRDLKGILSRYSLLTTWNREFREFPL